ncbi:MAG: hypothetical protein ACREB3_05405 [Burkholderiales bacterium]
MKTFLKILLIAVLVLVALKFSPVIFIGALVGGIAALVLGALGASLVVALLAVVIGIALALSPIWIPVLVVMGLISLFKRMNDKPAAPAATA